MDPVLTVVDENHLQLSSIPGIHQSWTVHHPDSFANREATPRNHEAGIPLRNSHGDTRGNEGTLSRLERHIHA